MNAPERLALGKPPAGREAGLRAIPWKLLAPLAAGVALSIAVLVFAELGHRRLEAASENVAGSFATQAAVHEVVSLLNAAETGQRGYLLTGRTEYLEPYTASGRAVDGAFRRLRDLTRMRDAERRDAVAHLNNLAGRKFAEMEGTLALYRSGGSEAALELLGTDLGRHTMDEIRATAESLTTAERASLSVAVASWQQDIDSSRLGMQLLTGFTLALLLAVWLLAAREMATRARAQAQLAQEQRRLEALVDERTAELSELSNYLHEVSEKEKSRLARDIHDELGSILVAAKMDVSWAVLRLGAADPAAAQRLERVLATLDDGVEVKRRLIEELRPTLLDHLGLGAAIQWQVGEVCARAGLAHQVNVPDDGDEPFPADVAIALYRIVQEALTNVVKYAKATRVQVDLIRDDEGVVLRIRDDGIGIPEGALRNRLSHGILGMRQRVRALEGAFSIAGAAGKGTTIEVRLPLAIDASVPPRP
jgi:signal transduction histidine kinase